MSTVRQFLADAAGRIEGPTPRLDAELLLAHCLGKPRSWLYAHGDSALDPDQAASARTLLQRRRDGEPVAYLLGRREFWSLELEVTPATLVPRPETELLVEAVLARLDPDRSCRVADLGTGSGAIALALASARPNWTVIAVELSAAALAVAGQNARRLGLRNVALLRSSWLDALGEDSLDLIAANPPYVCDGDPALRGGELRFEPIQALAGGPDGLAALRAIVAGAPRVLRDAAPLLLEHGADQGAALRELMRQGGFGGVETRRDLAGNERLTLGVFGGG